MIFNSLRPCFFWPVHAISQHHAINISLLNWPRVGMKTPFSSTSLRFFSPKTSIGDANPSCGVNLQWIGLQENLQAPQVFPPNIGLKPVGKPSHRPTRHHSAVEPAGARCSPHALRHCAWKGLPAREDIANNAGTTWES